MHKHTSILPLTKPKKQSVLDIQIYENTDIHFQLTKPTGFTARNKQTKHRLKEH